VFFVSDHLDGLADVLRIDQFVKMTPGEIRA
jgi:hypothetical protein